MPQVLEQKELYEMQFQRLERDQQGGVPDWVHDVRRAAMLRFMDLGFPTTKHEEWRFTNVASLAAARFAYAGHEPRTVTKNQLARFTVMNSSGTELVFVNGRYAPELSSVLGLPDGARVSGLGQILATDPGLVDRHLARYAQFHDQAFTALNTAFLGDGAFVDIPPHTVIEQPVHLLFVSTAPDGAIVEHPRTLIVVGENSQVRIVESYVGLGDDVYFTNAVSEIAAGDNTVVDHYKVQRESVRAFHVASQHVHLSRSSTFSSYSIALGGGVVRNDVMAVLDGEGTDCTLNGLYIVDGQRLVDNHTTIDHAKPHCGSHEVYKGILDEQGQGVFNGKILVRKDAQKTDAKQTNKTLLLSDTASINTKPQLEIFADDVKCTHGATVGQLDEDALFYLRSRGISYQEARSLLIYAFASDLINRVQVEPLRAELDKALLAQLPAPPRTEGLHP